MKRRHRQRGIAIVIVLATVLLFFVVSTMAITASRSTRLAGKVQSQRAAGRYAAESALAYIEWMVLSDRAENREMSRLGETSGLAEDDLRLLWAADGKPFTLYPDETLAITFRILDANRGRNIEGKTPGGRLRGELGIAANPDDPNDIQEIDIFLDALDDYTDGDDQVRLHGREQDDYQAEENLENFPRNAPLEYAEEALWLPNVHTLMPGIDMTGRSGPVPEDLLRIVPPQGRSFPRKPAFFSSSLQMIQSVADLTSEEMQVVVAAREQWYENRVPIREGLGELYPKIARRMTFDESGIFIIDVTASYLNGEINRRVAATIELDPVPRAGDAGHLVYWRRLFY